MYVATALHTLDQHQALIRNQLALARALSHRPAKEARGHLAQIRWHLVRLLRHYQLFKHGEIFDPVSRSGHAHRAVIAGQLKASCIEAGERYRAHTMLWSVSDIEADWPAYVDALQRIARSLDEHLVRERLAVLSLLAGCERTRRDQGGRTGCLTRR